MEEREAGGEDEKVLESQIKTELSRAAAVEEWTLLRERRMGGADVCMLSRSRIG